MAKLCDREFEVLECAAAGAAGSELRAHIASCAACRELFESASAIADDRAALIRNASIPSAGLVWWRSEMRLRREAARAAVRAGSAIQAMLLVIAIAAGFAVVGVSIDFHAVGRYLAASSHLFAVPLLAIAACLLLAPVAVYFAVSEK